MNITKFYCQTDDTINNVPRHSKAILSSNEVVSIGILYAAKDVSHALMGIAASYGVELRHPIRDGCRAGPIELKGISSHRSHRQVVSGKLCAGQYPLPYFSNTVEPV